MTPVTSLNLAQDRKSETQTNVPPANIEAEQALLGALLYDNAVYERIGDHLRPTHFYEPLHQHAFQAIETNIRRGHLADPITVAKDLEKHPAFEELGGLSYLADLVDRAPPGPNANDYARQVWDMAQRREMIRVGEGLAAAAREIDTEIPAAEIREQAEGALFALGEVGQVQQGFISFSDAVTGAVRLAAEAHSRDGGLAGVSTGLIDVDRKIGGMHSSDLMILAGRPSMGKSALACNIGFDVARKYAWEPTPEGGKKTVAGGVVAFFSLEMSAEQLAMRLLAEVSGVSGDKIPKGEIDASEFARVRDAALEIQDAPFFIDATGGLSIAKLSARARRLKRQHGLDLLIVDYLQLITSGGGGREVNRVQEVSMITQALKALAKELGVPILALSQLSRQVEQREDKRPQLSDLRESGSIEQDADMVMFVYREEYYLGRTEPRPDTSEHLSWQEKMDQCRGLAELIIGKQRHGPIGTIRLAFDERITKFSNHATEGHFAGAARSPYRDDA